jgi:hypothetical protein
MSISIALLVFGWHHSKLKCVTMLDVTYYDDLGCFCLFLFFGVVLFIIIYVGEQSY